MSLLNNLQTRIVECMRCGLTHERDILKTVIGEAQLNSSRTNKPITDDDIIAVLKKSKQNVEQTMVDMETNATNTGVPVHACALMVKQVEITIYNAHLPQYMSVDAIWDTLTAATFDQTEVGVVVKLTSIIKDAKSDGQATGVAMKYLKANNYAVQGQDVTEAIKMIRAKVT